MALLIFMVLRNFGQTLVYGAVINFKPQHYECRESDLQSWRSCKTSYICEMRNKGESDFEYQLDKSKPDYIVNWYVTLDLMCEPVIVYSSMTSFYLIGYGLGVVSFFLPDTFGRKRTMNYFVPSFAIAAAIVIYSPGLTVKKVAFFVLGFLHLKSN